MHALIVLYVVIIGFVIAVVINVRVIQLLAVCDSTIGCIGNWIHYMHSCELETKQTVPSPWDVSDTQLAGRQSGMGYVQGKLYQLGKRLRIMFGREKWLAGMPTFRCRITSLCIAVMIWATLVNISTHTHRDNLWFAILLAEPAELKCNVLVINWLTVCRAGFAFSYM